MHRLHQTITPFLVAMTIGLLVHGFVNSGKWRNKYSTRTRVHLEVQSTPLKVLSVPDLDFPEVVKQAQFGGTVNLQALFDSDGTVKSIRPYPMLPYGVPESEAGHGKYAGYTSAMIGTKFVKELPFGLTDLAKTQVSKIQFLPKYVNGEPQAEWTAVQVSFGYSESRYSVGCSQIEITVIGTKGIVWQGNIWTHRNRGCVLI